jgi:hypothetical protein
MTATTFNFEDIKAKHKANAEDLKAKAPRVLKLSDWRSTRFAGPPPEIKWLVKKSIPLGVPVLLASLGGVGKSYLAAQVGYVVSTPPIEDPKTDSAEVINLNYQWPILGGTVGEHGKAVIITAEDHADAIHRRLSVIDPPGRRTDDLMIVPLPSAGGPMLFFAQDRDGVRTTDEWRMIREQLLEMEGLRLVVIDPLAAFAQVNLDADSAACQFVMTELGRLAAETAATVMVCHHMRKAVNGKAPQTPAEAREAIRGSSALVDGSRLAYALWPVDKDEAEKTCLDLKIPFKPNRVVKGAIVKTNEIDGEVSTYVRSDGGLLIDYTGVLRGARPSSSDLLDLLVDDVAYFASDSLPLQKTGAGCGVYEMRECLHPSLRNLSRNKLHELCQELIDTGRIVKCRASGSNKAVWLDVPGGPYARATDNDGLPTVRPGSRTKRYANDA